MKKFGWKQIGILAGAVVLLLIILRATGMLGGSKGLEVDAGTATSGALVQKVSESGIIQPDLEVPIASDVSGEVISLHVKEGDFVRKGQLLFTVRPDNLRAQYEQATAALNSARADYDQAGADVRQQESNYAQDSINYNRQKGLFDQKVISQADFETARLRMNVTRAQLESARQRRNAAFFRIRSAEATQRVANDNLNRTTVFASMDGTITKMTAQVGQRVVGTGMMAGSEVIKIADLTRMEVEVDINENDIRTIALGDTATVEVDAYPDHLFQGRVTEVAYSANVQGTGTQDQITNYKVRVAILPESYVKNKEVMRNLPATEGPFRPGMSAVVNIFTDKVENAVMVPIQAVTVDRNAQAGGGTTKSKEVVYVLNDDGSVKMTSVRTGISDDLNIEVKEGLAAGAKIITGPYAVLNKQLTDGAKVKVREAKGRGGKPGEKKEGEKKDGEKKPEQKADSKPAK